MTLEEYHQKLKEIEDEFVCRAITYATFLQKLSDLDDEAGVA
jgi:hypothetical protein